MAITDNKTFGWNINFKQALGLVAIIVVVAAAIWTDSLVIGYIGMTLVLCAFFMVVALDIGIRKPGAMAEPGVPERDPDARAAGGRTARQI